MDWWVGGGGGNGVVRSPLKSSFKIDIIYAHAFGALLCIQFFAEAFQSEEAVLWRKGTLLIY